MNEWSSKYDKMNNNYKRIIIWFEKMLKKRSKNDLKAEKASRKIENNWLIRYSKYQKKLMKKSKKKEKTEQKQQKKV